jgi:rSAM/selenodomain-associated transferase 1
MGLPGSNKNPKWDPKPPGRRDAAAAGERALIIFAILPKPGDVKKRLAKEIGVQPAATLYNDLSLHTFRTGQDALERGWVVYLVHDPKVKEEEVRQWVQRDFHYVAEQGENPGERMQHAFDYAFHNHAGKAVIISSDIPGMEYGLLEEASGRLDTHDVVIGPATDGGCYLLGMKPPTKGIFRDLPWGTPRVYGEASERVRLLGLTQSSLARLSDVDTGEAYRTYLMKKQKG